MSTLSIETPRWALPLLEPKRYKGAAGGRSSGKSHEFAGDIIEAMIINPDLAVVCIREIQKSLKFSAKKLLESKIELFGVGHMFDVQATEIRRKGSNGIIIFQGMQDHTADSVKSLESFDIAWCEEAQSLSKRSIELLDPTMRKPGCELWFSWNPEFEDSPVETEIPWDDEAVAIRVNVNYVDNPFCPQEMHDLAARLKKRDIDAYNHIWLGGFVNMTERQIFKHWTVKELEVPRDVVWFYGADWGFANDPTASLRCCILGNQLYIDQEVSEVGVATEATPGLLAQVEDSTKWPMLADSANPQMIDYVRRHGFTLIRGAKKGKGSIEDGINFLKGFDIVVHPRCIQIQRELKLYSYKVDKRTDEVLPVVEDKHNHLMDALRYAVEGLHKKGTRLDFEDIKAQNTHDYDDGEDEEDSWRV